MIQRHGPTAIFHKVVEHAGVLYLSGMTASDPAASMKVQTEQILGKIDEALQGVGSDRSKVLAATIYITDMALKPQMNEAWTAFFAPDQLPARATLGVADLGAGILIEVMVTATR